VPAFESACASFPPVGPIPFYLSSKLSKEVGAIGSEATAGLGSAIATPLFHTSFLPLFMQVYFFPLAVAVDPTFLQVSPAFTAATAFNGTRKVTAVTRMARSFFTEKG